MIRVLAFLAALALLANSTMAAATPACHHAVAVPASQMTMPGAAAMGGAAHDQAPCHEPRGKPPHCIKYCAQACAAGGGVAVAPGFVGHEAALSLRPLALAPPPRVSLPAHEPGRLDRPPKRFV